MWQKLNGQHRNYVLIAVGLLICYFAYQLSFRRTFEAIVLYWELLEEQEVIGNTYGATSQTGVKNDFYIKVLGSYGIKSEDSEGAIWESISGISQAKGVSIGFNPSSKLLPDSLEIKNNIFRRDFSFKGNYFELIALVDSISRTMGIGKVASLRISVPKETKIEEELELKLTVMGIQ